MDYPCVDRGGSVIKHAVLDEGLRVKYETNLIGARCHHMRQTA